MSFPLCFYFQEIVFCGIKFRSDDTERYSDTSKDLIAEI